MLAVVFLLLFCAAPGPVKPADKPAAHSAAKPAETAPAEAADREDDPGQQLAKVRRVFVDLLTGGDSALQIRDLLMASLQSSKLVIVTEDEDRADAVLKGAAGDSVFTEFFSSSEGLNLHSQISTPGSDNTTSQRSGRAYASMGLGENESRRSEQRKHEALATVRLVSKEGDVIWSTTQESLGGKFLGASADVADKIAKKLASDIARAKRQLKP